MSSTAEVEAGEQYLDEIAQSCATQGIDVETAIRAFASPRNARSCAMRAKSIPTW